MLYDSQIKILFTSIVICDLNPIPAGGGVVDSILPCTIFILTYTHLIKQGEKKALLAEMFANKLWPPPPVMSGFWRLSLLI